MKRSLLYIVLAISLTYLVREFLYAGIRKNSQGEFAKLREVFLDTTDYDLLIIGSSRAESQYNPRIIDSICHTHSYNAGMLGATLPYMSATYDAWNVNHSKPKTLVINIDYHAFADYTDTIHHYPRYFPYFANEVMYDEFSERDKRLKFAKWIAPYSMGLSGERYLNAAVRGWLNIPGRFDHLCYQGYNPVPFTTNHPADPDTLKIKAYKSVMPDTLGKILEQMITAGKKDGQQVILVLSPLYHRLSEKLENEKELKQYYYRLAANYPNTRLIDLSEDSMRFEKKYFADPAHLNAEGASLFSEKFSLELNRLAEKR